MNTARCSATILLVLLTPLPLTAQRRGGGSLDLMIDGYEVSFGHNPRVNGLRINFRDRHLDRVNGVNLTLWQPYDEVGGTINGLGLGVVGPAADHLNGVSFGLGAPVAKQSLSGIGLGGLAVVSDGQARGFLLGGLASVVDGGVEGVSLGGLASVTEGPMEGLAAGLLATVTGELTGIGLGGLATVTRGPFRGIGFGGLATVAGGSLEGISVGGLAVVAEGDVTGAHVGGLAVVGQWDVTGINAAGLAVVAADGDVRGVTLAGLAIDARMGAVEGVSAALYRIRSHELMGFSMAGWVDVRDMTGVSVAGFNKVQGRQTGLTIGVFNSARYLEGIQIGLLNHAANNREGLRWLPFFNAHFD